MYQSHSAKHYRNACNALALPCVAVEHQPKVKRLVVSLVAGAVLTVVLAATAQQSWAQGYGDSNPGDSNYSGSMGAPMSMPNTLTRLDDDVLESVRGRYVKASELSGGTDSDSDFVILWDERPGGSGGSTGSGKSHSTGQNNQQSTRVTTWRGQ